MHRCVFNYALKASSSVKVNWYTDSSWMLQMSAEEQHILSSFSFNSIFMSLPRRSKLLCGEPHYSGWRASGGGRMDCLFLYLQRWNLANIPARHVWTAPAARRRRFQTDGGAGDGEREGAREAERKRALAQVGCNPMMASASLAWRNTTCVGLSANADLFHPLHTQDIRSKHFTDCILGYVLHVHGQESWCDMLVLMIPNLSILSNIQKTWNKICHKSQTYTRSTHCPEPYETCQSVWPNILYTC